MGNLGTFADWYIEEKFSYIRVFGCSIPPHALPQFLPDRLVCREVAYQIVAGGITKELKAAQKKVWPTFPIQVGMFTLLDFGHSKVEAATLEDVKLVDIEFKRHDPHKDVENHLAQYNMKRYIHEESPYDEIFRGVRSYEEVQSRFQTLPPDQQVGFLSFQKHRQNNFPKILQGESKPMPSSQEAKPTESEPSCSTKNKVEEVSKSSEGLFKEIKSSLLGLNDQQILAQFEAFMNQGQVVPHSTPATPVGTPNTTGPENSTTIISPIPSLTPLQTSFGTPSSELIHVDDLTPILPEEMPPSSFFFNKKQKSIVKRESQQKDGVVTKRKKLVYDGKDQDDPKFAKEVADSLGDFSTANQWSVDNLTKQLQQKCLLVEQLQNEIHSTEQIVRSRMNQDIEKIRVNYQHQMKQLQDKIELIYQSSQTNKGLITQRDNLIEQLQAKLALTENTTIDITAFKTQASEINEKLEVVQQELYQKVDTIQKCYQAINISLKSIYVKEKDACVARSKFQEFIIWRQKANIPGLTPFSHYEQVKGEMALKVWETNMEERKKLARDAKEACLETLSSVNKKLIEFEENNISEALGQIEIEMNQENSRKNKENIQSSIQQMNQIDLLKINELLVNPNLQYQITAQEVKEDPGEAATSTKEDVFL
jgi:hypothetical protein